MRSDVEHVCNSKGRPNWNHHDVYARRCWYQQLLLRNIPKIGKFVTQDSYRQMWHFFGQIWTCHLCWYKNSICVMTYQNGAALGVAHGLIILSLTFIQKLFVFRSISANHGFWKIHCTGKMRVQLKEPSIRNPTPVNSAKNTLKLTVLKIQPWKKFCKYLRM